MLKHFDMLHCKPISTPTLTSCKFPIEGVTRNAKETGKIIHISHNIYMPHWIYKTFLVALILI